MPQIAQLTEDGWYLLSQIFWLLIVFGGIYVVIGRGMLPKIEATVDLRDRKIADDLAAAKAAHAGADTLDAQYRATLEASRAEAQKAVQAAKDKAARDAEKKLAKADADVAAKLAAAEAELNVAKSSAMAEIEAVAADAARDLVARLSGAKVSPAEADKAVKAVIHG
jgi:F-type H+-transporting ATPase subunit b